MQCMWHVHYLQCCLLCRALESLHHAKQFTGFLGTITVTKTYPNSRSAVQFSDHLPGVFKGPGDGTLKFWGVRAAAGLWDGCGDGLGRKLLGDGAGPELKNKDKIKPARIQQESTISLWADTLSVSIAMALCSSASRLSEDFYTASLFKNGGFQSVFGTIPPVLSLKFMLKFIHFNGSRVRYIESFWKPHPHGTDKGPWKLQSSSPDIWIWLRSWLAWLRRWLRLWWWRHWLGCLSLLDRRWGWHHGNVVLADLRGGKR